MRLTRFGAIACVALLAACAGGSANRPAAGGFDPESLHEVMLLPLNLMVDLPNELEEGAPRVEAALQSYFVSQGKRVSTLDLADAHRVWAASAGALRAEVGEEAMSFEGAARLLARRLHELHAFDVLVLPALVFRPARLYTRRVSWDGVERSLETVDEPTEVGSMWLANTFHGEIRAPSLLVYAFSPDGAPIFQGVGGLDLAHRARILPGARVSETRWTLERRPELFSDASLIQEGIAIALDPLLPRNAGGE